MQVQLCDLFVDFLLNLICPIISQISLKADERDVYEFFSRAGKVIFIFFADIRH